MDWPLRWRSSLDRVNRGSFNRKSELGDDGIATFQNPGRNRKTLLVSETVVWNSTIRGLADGQ